MVAAFHGEIGMGTAAKVVDTAIVGVEVHGFVAAIQLALVADAVWGSERLTIATRKLSRVSATAKVVANARSRVAVARLRVRERDGADGPREGVHLEHAVRVARQPVHAAVAPHHSAVPLPAARLELADGAHRLPRATTYNDTT